MQSQENHTSLSLSALICGFNHEASANADASQVFVRFDCERYANYGSLQFAGVFGLVQKTPPSVMVWLAPFSVANTSNS
jgi:hypothetical protein